MELKSRRYDELDSLRGIAAIIVVLCHIKMILPEAWYKGTLTEKLLAFSPLKVLVMGHESVVFFFLLSGFVLALPYMAGKQSSPLVFVVRRILRIWGPYVVAIVLAMGLRFALSSSVRPKLGNWYNQQWQTPFSPQLTLDHVALVGTYDVYAFNVSIWSLVHEMRISLFFPLLMLLLLKRGWKWSLGVGVVLGALGGALYLKFNSHYPANFQPLYKSLPYVIMFLGGAALAVHKEAILPKVSAWSSAQKWMLLVGSVLVYAYSTFVKIPIADDWVASLGAIGIMVSALTFEPFRGLLHWGPVHWLGKVSYSLYLLHMILFLSLIGGLSGRLPLPAILTLGVVILPLVSWLFYVAFEVPSIKLGRAASAWVTRRS